MEIIINEYDNLDSDIYLIDGNRIIEYKMCLSHHLVKDFIISLIIRYALPKNALIHNSKISMTLDEYARK